MMRPLSDLFSSRIPVRSPSLGRLEAEVLRVLWGKGESSVRDVLGHLSRPLAYTTVMTTLDRLFKKGLLDRRMSERSFLYVPCVPRRTEAAEPAAEASRASELFYSQAARELLVSHLVDTVCEYDETLLAELEQNIAERRRQYEAKAATESESAAPSASQEIPSR
jgi:predicted transcriptional regulator